MTTENSPCQEKRKSGDSLRYTAAQRRHESRETKRNRKLAKKKTEEIMVLEEQLATVSSRATTLNGFKEYLKVRFSVQNKLYDFYGNSVHREYRWFNWKSRQRSEACFVNLVVKTFGEGAVLAYGNWSER